MNTIPSELENIILDYKYQLEHNNLMTNIVKDINSIKYNIYGNESYRIYNNDRIFYINNKLKLIHIRYIIQTFI